jgi:hypothetical protein
MGEANNKKEKTWIGMLADDGYKKSRDQIITQFRERVIDTLSVHKTKTADMMTNVAVAIRRASEELGDHTQLAALEAFAADKIDDASRFLDKREMGEVVEQIERIARRHPAVLLGSTFVFGFLFARYVTNSNRLA